MDNLKYISPEWLAGFFDGEGSISASLHGCSYNVIVTISQSNFKILCEIASNFPGATWISKKNSNIGNYKSKIIAFSIQWRGTSAKEILTTILPYLKLKKDRAEAALKIIETLGKAGQNVSEDVKEVRKDLALKIKIANKEQSESSYIDGIVDTTIIQ